MRKAGRCASCGKPAAADNSNPWRPFCSERCRTLDLGEWFSGRYSIPAESEDEFPDLDGAPPPPPRYQ